MKKRLAWGKLLKAIILILTLVGVVSAGMIGWDGLTDELAVADVGVVLGSKVEQDGSVSPRLKARLDKAVELYKKGWFPKIVVSGGVGKEGYDEAVVMRRYLVEQGIPAADIFVDGAGINTYFTAKYSAHLVAEHHWKSALVISQYFHISRTRLALERFGVPRVYSAHADFFEIRDVYSLGREVVAYAYYLIRRYQ